MIFTEKETQKYNGVSAQDLKDFNKRNIVFISTGASCLEVEDAVLTLENERIFYDEKNKFFERLKNSYRFKDFTEEKKQTFFYKWLGRFLVDFESKNKAIKYIYEKLYLNHLKEASIILFNQEETE